MHTRGHAGRAPGNHWYLFGLGLQALKIIGDIFQLLLELGTLTAPRTAAARQRQKTNEHKGRDRQKAGEKIKAIRENI